MNHAFDTCIQQEAQNLPNFVGYNDKASFVDSLHICAYSMFVRQHKEKFTFDKSPDCMNNCKIQKAYIEKLQ